MGCKCVWDDLEHPLCPYSDTTICSHFVLANVTQDAVVKKLELIGDLAKMSQVMTPEA